MQVTIPAGFDSFTWRDLGPANWALGVQVGLGGLGYTVFDPFSDRSWLIRGVVTPLGDWPEGAGSRYEIRITGLSLTAGNALGEQRTVEVTGLDITFRFGVTATGAISPLNGLALFTAWDAQPIQFRFNETGNSLSEVSGTVLLPEGPYTPVSLGGNDSVQGGAGHDVASTGPGNDLLDGGDGADALFGGAGDDSLLGRAGDDELHGDNTLALGVSPAGTDTLRGGEGNDLLYGDGGNDLLYGDAGNDTLDGGAGADRMFGGAGNDRFFVDDLGDRVTEAAGGGWDTVESRVSFRIGVQEIEALYLTGEAAISGTGNALANLIQGNTAANTLDGMGGADTMLGGGGDDSYHVDDAGDVIVHTGPGGHVLSSLTYILPEDVLTRVTLLGDAAIHATGNNLDNRLLGNAAANRLEGGDGADSLAGDAGDDTLDGGTGADRLEGGAGSDSYIVDHLGDRVSEVAGAGFDSVISSVTFALPNHVEGLRLAGNAAINATGNNADNMLVGNDGVNRLTGRDGADTLDGGLGADVLTGGAGADLFLFTTAPSGGNVDRVMDFNPLEDSIGLLRAAFTGLAAGPLDPAALVTGSAATTAAHRLIYTSSNGALAYDADGVGGQAAIRFAILPSGLTLTAGDFLLV